MASELELNDSRVEFIADYVLKSLKQKPDKFGKMYAMEDQKAIFMEFLEKPERNTLVVSLTGGGALQPALEWPKSLKSKACYFVKKNKEGINKDTNLRTALLFGDISSTPIDQLAVFVEEVLLPIFSNERNHDGWPRVVYEDVLRHVQNLRNSVHVISGQVKGKTMLPIPVENEKLSNAVRVLESGATGAEAQAAAAMLSKATDGFTRQVLHSVETIIIEWAHQIRDVLKHDSSEALLAGTNPLPQVEFEFWKSRAENLETIYDQLCDERVKKMSLLLEKTNSSYFAAFKEMFSQVLTALSEAQEINLFLKALKPYLDDLGQADFDTSAPMLSPLFHVICLTWANCKSYCEPSRLIVLLAEICNLYISQCRAYLDATSLFKGEIDETLIKIDKALELLHAFRNTYEDYRTKVTTFFKDGNDPREWEFAPVFVFARFDAYLQRVTTIRKLFQTASDFVKLEKIEFGGLKGRVLTAQTMQIFEEFQNAFKIYSERTYDALDPASGDFPTDYKQFESKVEDLDRRLGAIACLAFDDASGPESAFKTIFLLGPILERPLIAKDFETRYSCLIEMCDNEMNEAKRIYDEYYAGVKKNGIGWKERNMPTISGALKWSSELLDRITDPISNLKHLEGDLLEGDEAKKLLVKYEELKKLLGDHEQTIFEQWSSGIDEVCNFNQQQALIKRKDDGSNLIETNFDRKLVAVLCEVKHLEIRAKETIPAAAVELFEKRDLLWQYRGNLDLMCGWYNKVRTTTLEVEMPLIAGQLESIDSLLEQGMTTKNWVSPDAWDYIQNIRDTVHDLEQRVQKAKDNVEKVEKLINTWSKQPLFEIKEGKYETLLNLDDRPAKVDKRYQEISDVGEKIHILLKENCDLFKADGDTDAWRAYVDYVDGKLVEGFFNTIQCTLKFLLENTEPSRPGAPLLPPRFEAQLELQMTEMVFVPSLDPDNTGGFAGIIDGLLLDTYKQASLVKRLAAHKGIDHYQSDMEEREELRTQKSDFLDRVQRVMGKANEYRATFEMYSYLWVDDMKEFMRQFLLYGHVLTPDELAGTTEDQIPQKKPTLDQFKEQIDTYEKLYAEVEKVESQALFDQWFRVDIKMFKSALLNVIKKWSLMFKQNRMDLVTTSLNDLEEFIRVHEKGLKEIPKEGDFDGLVKIMGHLMAVKDRQPETDNMFEPLKQTIELLKSYGQDVPDEVYDQLQELPEKWNNLKKVSTLAKQTVAPLQTNEVNNIRRKSATFDVQQHQFRERFRQVPAFKFECPNAYEELDKLHLQVTKLETDMEKLIGQAELFEVNVPDYRQLKQCRKELKLLKQLWDYCCLVRTSIDDWKTTRWREIDVEMMDMELKRFAKDIRGLDKEMRAWDTYTGLDNTVKNIMTSLRAVAELQNSAIRDRHWAQLMQATKVRFEMDDKTTLADLLSLNLHKFEEEVKNIVDKAVKEMGMEKVLNELDTTWSTMEFEHEKHARTGITSLKVSEEIIETLEGNQVQLQNMLTSKFIGYFLEQVTHWQKTLSTTDQVISIYFEVQRTWSHLESIFIGSEDIRTQLPEDSKRFDEIDRDFKTIVSELESDKNIVRTTNRPNLYERLELIQSKLAICEKALAEYLETKRLAFPRFYFVSSADLLDILSNGNEPPIVSRHLTKLFDSLAKLKFVEQGGQKLKQATGMYAKDGEFMDFAAKCDLSGQVEIWLNRVLEEQRHTIRHFMTEAVNSYEEKPRDQWIFDNAAQVSLTASQIWWTTEVGIAFGRLEEGYENALKDYNKKQIQQLNQLVTHLLGQLTPGDRQKIMTICTIDVHARDVVGKLIAQKVENSQAFAWLSQLRHRWDDKEKDCFANICDAQFQYAHEYLGCTPRLVVTPLTDRCYITLTQSLHLTMSGAPAGPAGTGKTETTKDLGRALGIMVYVFNCSEQMDYKSIGNIYKGLAQSGAWGCFDEFNRIAVEVLSVVAVQVKTIQDAIRAKRSRFNFLGDEINLNRKVGLFITMNPGYAGRTELPENLKTLFRPCAMVVPDFELICEIMLVAEGFLNARLLARKFITLYSLCKDLLSKQDHYDWGLRAIKSVLVVAGALRRGDPERPEDQVLMRALRDFNIPKIVTDDLPVFMGLIGDLFPALDVPRKRDPELEKNIRQASLDLKLQPEDSFILKVVQLQELLDVRHSVFIVGNAGTGKTQVWRTLNRTYQNAKRRPVAVDLNPKAVTNNELFGFINPSTREWKDGLFSSIMRDLANVTHDGPKWIVFDGDIDPMWIESLNTVMDDNKVLTLASNERIPLTPSMRLLFEISHLKTATPATVSRAGILFINPTDLGWSPYVTSWIDKREVQSERANLMILFDKYVPPCLDALRTKFKKIVPLAENSHIQMLCYLLECMLTPENTPPDSAKELYELYFVYCCVWAFGGALFQDQLVDYRLEFSKWWTTEFKGVKFPASGTVFDFYIDPETKKFDPWVKKISKFELDPDIPLQSTLVHTAETVRIRYFLDLLLEKRRPVMLVGGAGTGKSVLMQDKLNSLPDDYLTVKIPLNFYTTSEMLQRIMEKPLEKKAGRNFGPPGTKRLIYFIDDLNMPEVDKYFTVQPHTLIRQHIDYSHWYDRAKLTLKEVHNCQYVACMNPTSGSFTIDTRLQRHFSVFAMSFPGQEAVKTIYTSILQQHLSGPGNFPSPVQKLCGKIVEGALALQTKVTQVYLPTAIKFHYTFNLRDLSNIFQGMLFSLGECCKTPVDLMRLWLHEAERVYSDKLVDATDIDTFKKLAKEICKKTFEGENVDEAVLFAKPLLFCHFANGIGEAKYMPVKDMPTINKVLVEALDNYNEVNAVMNLVLFEDAIQHVLRINRILESPRGNALLVGVGGSGKQSLSRLAAYISSLEVSQITLKKGYSVADLRTDLAVVYNKCGIKNVGMMFLMTDAQIADERFLVLINDMLASGEIPELFPDDEIENIIGAMRNVVKGMGLMDTRENCWRAFIDKVRRLLKCVLCMSPVGSTLRVRARKFPALVNATQIDWFHEWPEEALISVSSRFVKDIELLPEELRESVSLFMAFSHKSVNETSSQYLTNERRYNYTTPKSFLELIALYGNLLRNKFKELQLKKDRLENGLQKLQTTTQQVDDLKAKLKAQEVEVTQKNEAANALIQVVGAETEKVSKEKAVADEEERKVSKIQEEVSVKAADCSRDLAKAEPALLAAKEALNTLNKNNLTELKSFGSPPPAVVNVTAAVMCLMTTTGKIPKDRSWKAAKVMMAKVDSFLDGLINYDKDHIPPECQKAVQPYLLDPEFDPEKVRSKSLAAAGLCAWAINIMKYYEVFCEVEPKRLALQAAEAQLNDATEKLNAIRTKLRGLEESLGRLTDEFKRATEEKIRCQDEADRTKKTVELANRLVSGLASENVRWAEAVKQFQEQEKMLPGDVLLISAYLSYLGYFTKIYRVSLLETMWMPYLKNNLKTPIPITEGLDPIRTLTDDAQVAQWNNEGLPADRMSTENATILTMCERWPLMVDPQLQGIKWIKTRYGDSLKVVRLGTKGYLDTIERAISAGDVVVFENIGESIDPVLDPILGRNTIKKGKAIRLGDKEIDYNPTFRLILHTKLANPHYKPEMQAQTTLINFTVTRDGLEDQLLAAVVSKERPDLEKLKSDLTRQQNDFKIQLKQLEDNLLARLSAAQGNFLGDYELVENLERTKSTAQEIEVKVKEAKVTEAKINEARELYRPAAARASLLYFIMNDLVKVHPMYQFSLKAFSVVFEKAIDKAVPNDEIKTRILNLLDSITYSVYVYTTRGLFERDKMIFKSQMTFQILLKKTDINPVELDFLLRFPIVPNLTTPVDFMSNVGWGAIKALSNMEEFKNLDRDIEGSAKRWKKFVESEAPENEKFPQEWKNKTSLQKLCMMRALRPDRMFYAMNNFIDEKLGSKYVEGRAIEFARSFEESGPNTPIFFILSAGVDPLKDVESLGKKLGFSTDQANFHNISLGQGQEVVAEAAIDKAATEGHWVVLQNIHLVAKWLPTLEKKIEQYSTEANPNYRLFMSAEPASSADSHIIPQGILEVSIKITNEPPTGMLANVHKALDNFTQETLEMCSRENEFKSILFALCYFHAVVCERRKFGPQGWNRSYPFNVGDLTICVNVLFNYIEANPKVPWDDLRYLFGEIMYGGHITDDWDRRLCRSYLEEYLQPTMFDGELYLAPGFPLPPNSDYKGYHAYIDENMPSESPYLYGMHPNAEIEFLTQRTDLLFRTVFEMQPRDTGASGGGGVSRDEKIKQTLDEILEKLPDEFNMTEIMAKVPAEERTPYVVVAFQECERMNGLTHEIRRSLKELNLGLKGELTVTAAMEELGNALFLDQVPGSWATRAYPSLYTLGLWYADLIGRIKELEIWTSDFQLPASVWLGGLFNPQSFLTAIMQQMARKNEWPLDRMCLQVDVTKKSREDMSGPPREGAYVHGLFMEGSRWDMQTGFIAEARLKELQPAMPVIFIRAIPVDRQDLRNVYECPVYKTKSRGPTFVWTFNLKSRDSPRRWILGGVALLLQV